MTELDIVIPVYNEADNIQPVLESLAAHVRTPFEVFICYDRETDTTLPVVRRIASTSRFPIHLIKNKGITVHRAILSGFEAGTSSAVLVFPADDTTNAPMLDRMMSEFRRGNDIVCASRFIPGGCMIGCPWLKAALVRSAAFSLYYLARLPSHDASNGFRLFSRRLLNAVTIESTQGFTYSIELLVKCHRLGWRVAEVPVRWIERQKGKSRFKVLPWLVPYLRWYGFAFATTWLKRGQNAPPRSLNQ